MNIIAEGPNLAISVSEELLEGMDEWNTTHHTSSGLVDRVRNEGVSLGEAIRQTCEFLNENIEMGTAPLCGNSIHNDRVFLAKEMPEYVPLYFPRSYKCLDMKKEGNKIGT